MGGREERTIVLQSTKESGRKEYRKEQESIISRLRFGHTVLNSSLFIIGKHGTGRCKCGQEETIEHVMLNCQKYEEERRHLVGNLTEAITKSYCKPWLWCVYVWSWLVCFTGLSGGSTP